MILCGLIAEIQNLVPILSTRIFGSLLTWRFTAEKYSVPHVTRVERISIDLIQNKLFHFVKLRSFPSLTWTLMISMSSSMLVCFFIWKTVDSVTFVETNTARQSSVNLNIQTWRRKSELRRLFRESHLEPNEWSRVISRVLSSELPGSIYSSTKLKFTFIEHSSASQRSGADLRGIRVDAA